MHEPDPETVERVAVAAATAAGQELRRRYGHTDGDAEGDYGTVDVKAAADRAAEDSVLPVITRAFPDHEVYAEESGHLGDPPDESADDWRWIVDPLDGTNDFVAGLPTFATGVTALRGDDPRVAVVHLPATDETYVARAGEGVRYDGTRVTADSDLVPETATVVTVIGRDAVVDPERAGTADALDDALETRVKRVIGSWAPLVHAGLLARGRVQGVTTYHLDREEQPATELLAREAGAVTERHGPLYLAAVDESTLATLREAAREVPGLAVGGD